MSSVMPHEFFLRVKRPWIYLRQSNPLSKTIEKFSTNDDVRKKIDQSSHIIYYKTFGKLEKILTKYFYGEASPKGKVS